MTHDYLTVHELAELLRLKPRKIYDLAAKEQLPCSRATGKLLFPEHEIREWLDRHTSGAMPTDRSTAPRPAILLGSHDPLLDWAVRQSECGLATNSNGSQEGLRRFIARDGVATGLHVRDPLTKRWNIPLLEKTQHTDDAVLVHFARRSRGLVSSPDHTGITDIRDVAGKRLAHRQPGSGAAQLLGDLLVEEGMSIRDAVISVVAHSEDDVVAAVRRGQADVSFGLEAVALGYGLRFHPIIEEEFSLLVDRRAWFEPQFQSLLTFSQSDVFADQATALGGYDISELGRIEWNG